MGEYWQPVWKYDDEWFIVRRVSGKKSVLYRCRQKPSSRVPQRFSLKHNDQDRAKQDLIRWRESSIRHVNGARELVTVRYCLTRYWTAHGKDLPSAKQIDTASRQILAIVGNVPVASLTSDSVFSLREGLRAAGNGKTNGGINRCLEVLTSALRWCWKRGELESVPFIEKFPTSPPKERVASVAELVKIYDQCDLKHLQSFFLLAIGTGGRSGAILELDRSQCDVAKRLINLNPPGRVQQRRKYRPTIRMADSIVPIIIGVQSGPIVNLGGLPATSNKKAFARACDRAGVEGITRHTLRHTVATWLREQDVPESECASFLGHKWSNATTDRYAHHRPDYQTRATAAIDGLINEIGQAATRPIPRQITYPADKSQTNSLPTFASRGTNP